MTSLVLSRASEKQTTTPPEARQRPAEIDPWIGDGERDDVAL